MKNRKMTETQVAIKDILRKYAFNKSLIDNADPNSNMVKDLKINSARIVDIVLDIEDAFGIEIDNKSLEKIKTIDDLALIIDSRTSEN